MKFTVCFSLLVLVVYSSQAHPVAEEQLVEQEQALAEVQELEVAQAAEPELHSRQKRARACNWRHNNCGINCIKLNFKDGYCNNRGVCVCRLK